MKIEFTPTFSDYWSLNIHFLWRQLRWIGYLSIFLIALYLTMPIWRETLEPHKSAFEMYKEGWKALALPGIIAFVVCTTYLAAKKRWTDAEELRERKCYLIDDDGIILKTASIDVKCEWNLIKEAFATKRHIFLVTGQRQYHYFPLGEVPDIEDLKRLVRSKVSLKD